MEFTFDSDIIKIVFFIGVYLIFFVLKHLNSSGSKSEDVSEENSLPETEADYFEEARKMVSEMKQVRQRDIQDTEVQYGRVRDFSKENDKVFDVWGEDSFSEPEIYKIPQAKKNLTKSDSIEERLKKAKAQLAESKKTLSLSMVKKTQSKSSEHSEADFDFNSKTLVENSENLKKAFIVSEILSKPVSMRR